MKRKTTNFILGVLLILIVWQLIALFSQVEAALFPAPLTVLQALGKLLLDGTLFTHLTSSLFRFSVGYTLAILTAVGLGLFIGRSTLVWEVIDPIVQLLRPISPVAWSPFIVLWFGIGNMPAIAIIFIAAFFPVLLTTVNGVRTVDHQYIKLAQNLQFSTFRLYRTIIFPAAFPSIISGLHIALGTAWVFLVAGEMVGAQSGLGYLIVDARNRLNLADVLAGIIIIGICGFLLDRLLTIIERTIRRASGYLV